MYIDKELDAEIEDDIKKHMEKCHECREVYKTLEDIDDKLAKLFTEKEAPLGFERRIINNLPEQKRGFNFREVFIMKKTLAVLIPVMLVAIIIGAYIFKNHNMKSPLSEVKCSLVALVEINNINYLMSGNEVITDERMIDKEIGVIEIKLDGRGKLEENNHWSSTIADIGTKVYSIKGISEKEAIALKIHDQWEIFRVMNGPRESYPIFTEEMLKAEKIVVRGISDEKHEEKEITNKEIINKIVLSMKNAEKVASTPCFYGGANMYQYYFVIRDSNGIGKIGHRYFITMQDINFNGYIDTRGNDSYKVSSEFNKLITGPFGKITSRYDETLGGKQQIYEVDIGCKMIFRRLIREEISTKSEITLLNQGESIWQNGSQITDNLKGKYKLQVIMKDTTVQKNAVEKAIKDITKMPSVLGINFTEGSTKDTLVVYICFDTKPEYYMSDSDDSLVIEMKE